MWASKNKVGHPLNPPNNNNNNSNNNVNSGYYIFSKTTAHNNYYTNESSKIQGQQGEHDYCSKKTRFMVQNTKKCNCPAQIHIREIVAYPGYKVKAVKMIVLLHPQGFTDTPRGNTQIQSSFCHSQAVSKLEFGRVRQYRCNS